MSSEPRGTVAFSLARIASQSRAARTSPRERIPTMGRGGEVPVALDDLVRDAGDRATDVVGTEQYGQSRLLPGLSGPVVKGVLAKVYSLWELADADDRDLALQPLVVDDERVVPREGIALHVHHETATAVERARRRLRAAGVGVAEAHE